jgi:hypothetical protein
VTASDPTKGLRASTDISLAAYRPYGGAAIASGRA